MAAIDVTLSDPEAFAGRTAIITGGCRGIGLVTARLMHSLGCNVVLGDLRPPPQTQEWTNTRSACYQKCDITNWDSVKALFERAKSEFGSIDIVCANAGINDLGDAFFSNELVDKDGTLKEPNLTTLDVNIKGTTYTVILGIHYLKANKRGGSIILTASLSGYFPTRGMPLYTASKHALVALMRTLTAPASANGIAISLVAPGMTETPLLGTLPDIREAMNGKAADEESLQALFANLRSIGIPSQEPDTVAQAILYLIEQGDGAAGLGLLVQGGEVIDLESELQRTRPEWLTQRMEYLLRSEAPVWKK